MDVVVTLPKRYGLRNWIAEGDPAGVPWSGQLYGFYMGGHPPNIKVGERVYVVYDGCLRGYALLVELEWDFSENRGQYGRGRLVRGGGAVAVTISDRIQSFRGWRYRWWHTDEERPFPSWNIA
ncbi:hypothetical protein LCGC14_1358770 [marine sediment metagenome]|uniref:Uncharacterized protein n=1 Tax=marine sediment metagenome TaxID=412755 RepID=A0A0F9MP38_9ZZZZ